VKQKQKELHIKNNKTGEEQTIPVSAFFVAIGHEPIAESLNHG
jgi:thioredoxin reductase